MKRICLLTCERCHKYPKQPAQRITVVQEHNTRHTCLILWCEHCNHRTTFEHMNTRTQARYPRVDNETITEACRAGCKTILWRRPQLSVRPHPDLQITFTQPSVVNRMMTEVNTHEIDVEYAELVKTHKNFTDKPHID